MPPNQYSAISRTDLTDSTRGVEPRRSVAIQQRKLARAREIAKRLQSMPFVRLIAVGNSVAMGTATELSDIDLFVVTAPNRLWTARFLLLVKAKWLGLTKRPGKTADQADFGFWVDETALDLGPIALRASSTPGESVPTPGEKLPQIDDPYLSRWLATLIPLVDRGGVYQRLIQSNQSLVNSKQVVVNGNASRTAHRSPLTAHLAEHLLGGWLGEPVEWLLFLIQRWKVWADPVAHRSNPLTVYDRRVYPEPFDVARGKHRRRVDVVTTRSMLKLHHVDQRAKYRRDRQQ